MEYYVHLSDDTIKALKEKDGSDSGGGESGGDSDYTTAEVTIIGSGYCSGVYMPYIVDTEGFSLIDTAIPEDGTYNVPLYKGMASADILDYEISPSSVSVTGDIEYSEGGICVITGNGSITINE